ncbi:carboxylesterase family protein [Mycolicibacterium neoaurum]|uniref:carboxylesterase family protein n=1 Tax=Mycolicibacterium neoaurum TaxID=1795 RepID=UPI002671144A|nr:carboxylesterase family protein [Mycolicibacterium neoaurum]MDO3401286.1 carboxylesterase family protein [Mycolicibacterium neoaurum]
MPSLLVQAPCGPLRAQIDRGLVHARGIRYATARRFSAPQEIADHTEPVDVSGRGPACPQIPSRLGFLTGLAAENLDHSEDCLVLSVTAPVNAHDAPVMVWFHGGAYLSGGGEAAKYDADALVAEGDVVVVTVTYRLGVFGYLAPDQAADGNAGLRDQIAALRWVQRNVRAFGGNPANVTVFGQSAGGDSVLCLLVADDVEGLLHRAIIQSAPLGLRLGRRPWSGIAQPVRAAFGDALGQADPRTVDSATLLRAQSQGAAAARRGLVAGLPFAPQPGVAPLPPAGEWHRRLADAAARVDLMVTYTRHDGAAFLAMRPHLSRLYKMGAIGRRVLMAISAGPTTRVFGRSAIRPLTTAWRAHPERIVVHRIDFSPPDAPLGACHCIELPLLFGTPADWSDAPMLGASVGIPDTQERARRTRRVWAEFAHHGLSRRARLAPLL